MDPGPVRRGGDLDRVRAALSGGVARIVLVVGEAGVGKSHLLDAVAEGCPTVRVWAARGLASVPLGAMAHLVTTGATLTDMVASVLAAVPAGGVLVVDDLDRLDEVSLAVSLRLARDRDRVLLASVRTEDGKLPEAVADLTFESGVATHVVEPFDVAEVERFLQHLLGDAVDAAVVDEAWRRAHGNALLISQMVGEARQRGTLVHTDAGWVASGSLGVPAQTRRLLLSRLDGLSADAVATAHLLSTVQRMPLAEVELSGRSRGLDELAGAGVVAWAGDVVRFAHPLFAETVWDTLSPPQRRRLLRAQAALARSAPSRDVVRASVLALEAGDVPDEAGLLTAARLAMAGGSPGTALRLALGAVEAEDHEVSGGAALLAATAHAELGQLEEAETLLRRVLPAQPIGPTAAALAVALHNLVVWGSADLDAAAEILRTQGERYPSGTPMVGDAFTVARADALVYLGRADEAVALLEGVSGELLPPELSYLHAGTLTHAYTRLGRTSEAITVAERGLHAAEQDPEGVAAATRYKGLTTLSNALREHGRLQDAADRAEQAHQGALADGRVLERAWAALNAAAAWLQVGDLVAATTWAQRSLLAATPAAMVDCQRLALAVRLAATGMRGEVDEVSLARLDGLPAGVGFLRQQVPIARAWTAVAQGRPGLARELLTSGLDEARASGAVVTQAWILHELLRLGARTGIWSSLADLGLDSPIHRARLELARGVETGDPAALVVAAAGFEATGAVLYAAEAHAELGRTAPGRAATRARRRAQELAARIGSPATPLLVGLTVDPLSPRERAVAERAASGESNAQIAATLHLSVRTVENHLARGYLKLGIASRAELSDALAGIE